jgi:hypothetical protein
LFVLIRNARESSHHLIYERKRTDHGGQQDSWTRQSCDNHGHLRSRVG